MCVCVMIVIVAVVIVGVALGAAMGAEVIVSAWTYVLGVPFSTCCACLVLPVLFCLSALWKLCAHIGCSIGGACVQSILHVFNQGCMCSIKGTCVQSPAIVFNRHWVFYQWRMRLFNTGCSINTKCSINTRCSINGACVQSNTGCSIKGACVHSPAIVFNQHWVFYQWRMCSINTGCSINGACVQSILGVQSTMHVLDKYWVFNQY